MNIQKEYCAVLVYGDIGRSPRMQYHTAEISKNTDFMIYFIGYDETKPNQRILSDPKIKIISLSNSLINSLKKLPRIFYLFYAFIRVFIQIFQLFHLFFFKLNKPKFVLVQNPPSIPVLSTIYFVSKIKGISFLVDMHNYGYTILALSIRQKLILGLAKLYEKFFAKLADAHFCVSKAMKKDLLKNWSINATCLYDKSVNDVFKPLESVEKQTFLKKMNFFNHLDETTESRTIMMISSTSWTKDEDFGIVLKALELYEDYAKHEGLNYNLPKIILYITGKGPDKPYYEALIKEKKSSWKKIEIITVWLESQDYPKLLACADIGLCLHYSSSGLDLPMKVVDMLGCGLPILAINYESIDELVMDNYNGRIFKDSISLFSVLKELLHEYPKNKGILDKYRENALKFRDSPFSEEWKNNVFPIVDAIQKGDKKWKKNDNTKVFFSALILVCLFIGRIVMSLGFIRSLF